jgi:protein subunit release factor B
MAVGKEKKESLERTMEELGVREEDLIEKFILGSGKGGQKINKTSSCVYLKHIPSGIEIKCQQDRSRELNRYLARKMLCESIKENLLHEKSEKQQLREKIRRQKRTRTRKQRKKMLEQKRIHSEKKASRKKEWNNPP